MNKKAYLQTLEAIVAILIIYIFITSVLIQNKPKEATVPNDIKLTQQSMLKEIESSNYYRNCVLYLNYSCIDSLIKSTVSAKYNYNFSLCTGNNCKIPEIPEKDVYLRSIIIAANLTDYSTTSVNLYIWRKI